MDEISERGSPWIGTGNSSIDYKISPSKMVPCLLCDEQSRRFWIYTRERMTSFLKGWVMLKIFENVGDRSNHLVRYVYKFRVLWYLGELYRNDGADRYKFREWRGYGWAPRRYIMLEGGLPILLQKCISPRNLALNLDLSFFGFLSHMSRIFMECDRRNMMTRRYASDFVCIDVIDNHFPTKWEAAIPAPAKRSHFANIFGFLLNILLAG